MIYDRMLMAIEVLLLVWIVWQGEKIRFYEQEVYRIQSEREKERKEWRDQKRKSTTKKIEAKSDTQGKTSI